MTVTQLDSVIMLGVFFRDYVDAGTVEGRKRAEEALHAAVWPIAKAGDAARLMGMETLIQRLKSTDGLRTRARLAALDIVREARADIYRTEQRKTHATAEVQQ
ncbi:MAG: hypothetical protein AAFP15_17555 [Bacteroidota bacterium]